MTKEIDNIYRSARQIYKKLNINATDLGGNYWQVLRWLLEVTLGAPDFKFEVILDPLVGGKISKRYYAEVTYRISDEVYLLKVFNNNEVSFNPYVDVELARKIAAAFEKWCELIYERAFTGSKI